MSSKQEEAASSEKQSSPPFAVTAVSSDQMITKVMADGMETIAVQTGTGLLVGGLVGLVLSRGRIHSSTNRVMAGLGSGIGLGSAWTRTSIQIEQTLKSKGNESS